MTKSRQSATKLRLSRLVRCLIALGCIKLGIMGVALFDLPMPSWSGSSTEKEAPATVAEKVQPAPAPTAISAEADNSITHVTPSTEELPTGSAAAELASAAKPRKPASMASANLPAPLAAAGPMSPFRLDSGASTVPLLPQPPSLGMPLAKAGVILPAQPAAATEPSKDNIWSSLDFKSLPIPVLGSAQAAHAAALDMPVPNTPTGKSPFTPAEQIVPDSRNAIVLPGAPPLPSSIPHGVGPDGAPLAPRQGIPNASTYAPPANAVNPLTPPAPNIPEASMSVDPNVQAQELARQQQDILILRQQMDQRLKDLQSAEEKMKDVLREAKDMEESKVKTLVQMYANMKPRMAAQAMENMDERIAVRILSGMAPKQSGEILTYTNPAKTAKFTEMLTRMRMMQ